jgi:hypothetical protein
LEDGCATKSSKISVYQVNDGKPVAALSGAALIEACSSAELSKTFTSSPPLNYLFMNRATGHCNTLEHIHPIENLKLQPMNWLR